MSLQAQPASTTTGGARPVPRTKTKAKAKTPAGARKYPGMKPVGILVPEAIYKMLLEFAGKDDRSVAYMANKAIREMLERNGYKMPDAK